MDDHKVILYTTHCPKCKVLAMKLEQKHIAFTECEDFSALADQHIRFAPALSVQGKILDFVSAVAWINNQ